MNKTLTFVKIFNSIKNDIFILISIFTIYLIRSYMMHLVFIKILVLFIHNLMTNVLNISPLAHTIEFVYNQQLKTVTFYQSTIFFLSLKFII